MFKVLIVDDEIYVVALIQKLIDWEKFSMKVEATANDGKTALSLMKEMKPDLVIVDIRMPGYDGIAFMDKVREFNKNVRFIVISGHKQFDYAKGAMRNNVEDYLLKPINKEELEGVLAHVYEQLVELRRKENVFNEMAEELDSSKQILRNSLLDTVISGENREFFRGGAEPLNKKFKTDFREGKLWLFAMVTDLPAALQENAENDLMLQEMHLDLKKALQEDCYEVVDGIRENRTLFLINFSEQAEDRIRQLIRNRMTVYENQTKKFDNLFIKICMGPVCSDYEELVETVPVLYQCILGRTALPGQKMIEPSDIKESETLVLAIWNLRKERFLQSMESLNVEEAALCIREIYSKAFYGVEEDTLLYYKLYIKLAEEIYRYFNNIGIIRESQETFMEVMEAKYIRASQYSEYVRILCEELQKAAQELSQLSDREQAAPAVRIVKRYIREHYKEEISLTSAADKVHISPVYLSRLFKKEEGINFLDYLNQYRIDAAKKLLKDVKYNVIEVSEEAGFKNTRYFSKIFKKHVGITPSEYRKRHLGKDGEEQ